MDQVKAMKENGSEVKAMKEMGQVKAMKENGSELRQ